MEAAKSSLKQELQELQEKLNNSQLREQSEICILKSQLAAYNYELHQETAAKEKLKAEMEIFKGNFSLQPCKLKPSTYFFLLDCLPSKNLPKLDRRIYHSGRKQNILV